MTAFLASVTSPAEARMVREAGADLIDLKNPARGALGALPTAAIRTIVDGLDGHPVSATIGDLPLQPGPILEAVRQKVACGVDYVKIGFFPGGNLEGVLRSLRPVARDHALIAVLFADYLIALPLLDALADAGFRGVMLDTAGKDKGPLTSLRPLSFLRRFVGSARTLGLMTGLAGSLRLEDIPLLLPLDPDYLGFRGALCAGGERQDKLDPEAVAAVRLKIPQSGPHDSAQAFPVMT